MLGRPHLDLKCNSLQVRNNLGVKYGELAVNSVRITTLLAKDMRSDNPVLSVP